MIGNELALISVYGDNQEKTTKTYLAIQKILIGAIGFSDTDAAIRQKYCYTNFLHIYFAIHDQFDCEK